MSLPRSIFLCVLLTMTLLTPVLLFAQGDVQTPPPETKESLWTLIKKGGPVMYPLGLCSILAVTFIIERAISLRRSNLCPPGFMSGLFQAFDGSQSKVDEGVNYCLRTDSSTGEIFAAGVRHLPRGSREAEEAIADVGARETDRLFRSLIGLKTIGQVSPLLGLLGTVYGMIGAFQQLAAGTAGSKSEKLAKGIYEALVTTATGLSIAIPVIIAHVLLRKSLDSTIGEIDKLREEFAVHYFTDTDVDSLKK